MRGTVKTNASLQSCGRHVPHQPPCHTHRTPASTHPTGSPSEGEKKKEQEHQHHRASQDVCAEGAGACLLFLAPSLSPLFDRLPQIGKAHFTNFRCRQRLNTWREHAETTAVHPFGVLATDFVHGGRWCDSLDVRQNLVPRASPICKDVTLDNTPSPCNRFTPPPATRSPSHTTVMVLWINVYNYQPHVAPIV